MGQLSITYGKNPLKRTTTISFIFQTAIKMNKYHQLETQPPILRTKTAEIQELSSSVKSKANSKNQLKTSDTTYSLTN